jgi:CRISPR/Cas system-associated exonuclease Cas4 (RecB family)
MRPIKVSEINTFVFCQRAWWYRQQNAGSQNQPEMDFGSNFHQQDGKKILSYRLLNFSGWFILTLAILSIVIGVMLRWLA